MSNWKPGDPERRKEMSENRDLIMEMRADIKYLIKTFDFHIDSDKDYQIKNDKKVDSLNATILLATGGVGVIVVLAQIFIKGIH